MIDQSRVSEILNEISPSVSAKSNKMGFVCRCPICGDSKKSERIRRLHVDYYSKYGDWIAKCYNGGCPITGSTNLISLYAQARSISYKQAKKYIDNEVFDVDRIKNRLKKKNNIEKKELQEDIKFNVSNEWLSVNDEPQDRFQERYIKALKEFIKKRFIPNEYPCFIGYTGRYKARIITPIFINKELKYYQGRSIVDGIEPKYLNPDVDKSLIISNSDKFHRNKNIIITEGIIDSWMVEDYQGTSCLGAYFSDELIKNVYEYTDKQVILCFDNPLVDKAGFEEISKFVKESKYRNKVRYFFVGDDSFKDLNDLRIKQPNLNIYRFVSDNSYPLYTIKAKLKLLYKYII